MGTTPTNIDNVIDSRDVIARIEELESDIEELESDIDTEELTILKSLAEEGEASPDWQYGETLIRDSYFQDYTQELAEDCCKVSNSDQWLIQCINWEQAAKELQMDYTCIDFDGIEYWIRA